LILGIKVYCGNIFCDFCDYLHVFLFLDNKTKIKLSEQENKSVGALGDVGSPQRPLT